MQDNGKKIIAEYVRTHKLKKRWHQVTAVLAALAVIITAAVMVMPAVTMGNSPEWQCALDLHEHTSECYGSEGNVICGYADFVVHTHNYLCYDEDGYLICPLEVHEAHTHTDACYTQEQVLTCTIAEQPGHVHADDCYTVPADAEPTCGLEESPGHTHGEGCYQTRSVLACGQEEGENHTHSDMCYEEQTVLICGQEEASGHTHTEECYPEQTPILTCEQEEQAGHTHTVDCYETQRVLTCSQEEIVLHTHAAECRDNSGALICGKLEVYEHVHDASCFPAPEPTEEPLPTPEPTVEPTAEATPEPTAEPTAEATPEPTVEPTAEATPEPTAEPTAEATPETTPEPTVSTDPDATSWATVEKPGYDPDSPPLAANSFISLMNEPAGTDFGPYITSTTIEVRSGDEWTTVVGGSVTDGSTIRVTINYNIDEENIVTADNRVIYYRLPNGIQLTGEENGTVEIGENASAGTYTITADGLITITFTEAFADGKPFAGRIQFQGEVSLADIGGGDKITFGGDGGIITIVPDAGETDLTITKTGEYRPDADDGKIYYTITVSSENGSDGAISVNDKFLSNGGAKCDENVVITGPDGEVAGANITYANAKPHFTISNLPALEAGESYTITYTATVDLDNTGTADGSLTVINQAAAEDGTNQVRTILETEVSGARIQKTGTYNPTTREIEWTVYIYNPYGFDLAGKVLSDTMVWTYDGDGQTVQITSATLTPYAGETPDDPQTIQLPYTFPEDSTHSYMLTYTTDLPDGIAAGEAMSVTNTAILDNWKAVYTIDGTMPGETGLTKYAESKDGDAVTGDVKWVSTIAFPQDSLTGDTLNSIRYVDIVADAVNENWQLQEGTHYVTPEQLRALVAAAWIGTTERVPLTYGTDYNIRVVTLEDFRTTLGAYYSYGSIEYIFKSVDFDKLFNGFSYGGVNYKFTWRGLDSVAGGTPIAMFAIEFTQEALDEVNAAGQIALSYDTHYDLRGVTGTGTFTLVNAARTQMNSAVAVAQTALLDMLNKQVNSSGTQDYALDSELYVEGPVDIDVGDTDGRIYYRILFYNFGDTISFHDDMLQQFNGHISFDSIKIYDAITGEIVETVKVWSGEHFESNPYWGNYTLKNLGEFKGNIIGLYYSIDVSGSLAEGETEIYTNTVEWEGAGKDSATANVTHSMPTVQKESVLGENNLVYYYVVINPASKNLHPASHELELRDTLTVSAGATATLQPGTIKLYEYDPQNAEAHYCGTDITDNPYFEVTRTEGEENSYTFTVPNKTACVVVYAYEIDPGTSASETIEVSNTVTLMGSAVISAEDDIQIDNQGSSSQANKATLTIYKIGGEDFTNLLNGVLFELARYEEQGNGNYDWVRTSITAEGEDGYFITGGDGPVGAIILNFLEEVGGTRYNTLYRLTEYRTLDGYELDTTPRYYVWGQRGVSEEETQTAMAGELQRAGVNWEDVAFIPYGESRMEYISNEPTTTSVRVDKIWQDIDGEELTETQNLPESVMVTLLRNREQYGEPVTLNAGNNWSYTWESLPKADENGTEYLYTVQETPVDGFETSYENNDGITDGIITVINKETAVYVLPETGGTDTWHTLALALTAVSLGTLCVLQIRRARRSRH